ncbi:hypothetical protein EDB80DRAFT_533602, partial [Ilyonectria destructans]
FPNVYQHRVSPFELVDKNRPGHRKILALFRVDPNCPIISTSNIPPQQQGWWAEGAAQVASLNALPSEIRDMVQKNVDFPISEDIARELRKELMVERSAWTDKTNFRLDEREWS